MKKFLWFLLKVWLFFLALFFVDRVLGLVFAYMGEHAKGGYVGHHVYVTDKTNEDILIFGSSRAIHHYNPQIISDSLGMSCYNCGQDGNGILLFYGMWQMIKERYQPKMIIYDLTPEFDINEYDNNQRYLGWLRADYDRSGVKKIFTAVDVTEQYKMKSMLYRYNSKFMQIITDYVHPVFGIEGNGFLPLKGEMDPMKIKDGQSEYKKQKVDRLKINFIERLIKEVKSVNLVFVVSPTWYGAKLTDYQPIRKLCEQHHVNFIDYSNNKKYVRQNKWFKDGAHLNAKGADEFSCDLVLELKNK